MSTVLVSIICNVVAVFILLGCIFGAGRNSWKVSLTRFCLMLGCGVGCYFATPALSSLICGVAVESSTVGSGISTFSVNSIIFTLLFVLGYGINSIICNIVRHCLIKAYRNKSENSAKMKRAKSINPRAEKLARKAAWREMKTQYKDHNRGFKRFISIVINAVVGLVLGLVVLMPFGYIAEDLNAANNGNKAFLEQGFDYKLNGVIDEKIDFKVFDWLISADEPAADEEPEEEIPCEHSFVEGVCEHCGEAEVPAAE